MTENFGIPTSGFAVNTVDKSAGKNNSSSSRKKKGKANRGPVTPKLPTFEHHDEEADFMINTFKVTLCSRHRRHTWSGCPYAHHGETARRREPSMHSAVPCPEMKQGEKCPRGDSCPYSHHDFEYWLHPARYRTVMCNKGTSCSRSLCFFAHTLEQLRYTGEELTDPIDGSPATDISPFGNFMDRSYSQPISTDRAIASSPDKDDLSYFAKRGLQVQKTQRAELKCGSAPTHGSTLTASSEICNILVSSSANQLQSASSAFLPTVTDTFSAPMLSRHQSSPLEMAASFPVGVMPGLWGSNMTSGFDAFSGMSNSTTDSLLLGHSPTADMNFNLINDFNSQAMSLGFPTVSQDLMASSFLGSSPPQQQGSLAGSPETSDLRRMFSDSICLQDINFPVNTDAINLLQSLQLYRCLEIQSNNDSHHYNHNYIHHHDRLYGNEIGVCDNGFVTGHLGNFLNAQFNA